MIATYTKKVYTSLWFSTFFVVLSSDYSYLYLEVYTFFQGLLQSRVALGFGL